MTEVRPPRVRCYSLRRQGRAAALCHALTVFVAIRSSATVRAALEQLGIEPDMIAQLRLDHQTWALSKAKELIAEKWRLAGMKLDLIEFYQRALLRAEAASADNVSPKGAVQSVLREGEFKEFSHTRGAARRIRDELAVALTGVERVLRRDWSRPFASMVANDNPAGTAASGAGE